MSGFPGFPGPQNPLAGGGTITTRKSRIVTTGGAAPFVGGAVINTAPTTFISSPPVMRGSFGGSRVGATTSISGGAVNYGATRIGSPTITQCPPPSHCPPVCAIPRGGITSSSYGSSGIVGSGAMNSSLVRSVSPPQQMTVNTTISGVRPMSPVGVSYAGPAIVGGAIGGAALGGSVLGGGVGGCIGAPLGLQQQQLPQVQ